MNYPVQPAVLYRIEQFPELFADACLRGSEGEFKFLSLYGRDGAILQLMAAMDLGAKDGGVQHFHLVDGAGGDRHRADVGNAERLVKHTGRLPRQNLFGPLTQVWLYDKSLTQVDRANRIGWVVHRRDGDATDTLGLKAWQLVRRLSPVALLDHWREPLMAWCLDKLAVQQLGDALYPVLGPVQAMRVSISDHFVKFVSDGVRLGQLKP